MTTDAARDELWRLIWGFEISQAIHVIAVLGIPDLIESQPMTSSELASRAKVDRKSLHRVLRTLAAAGVLSEQEAGHFALTEVGSHLRSAALHSQGPMAKLVASNSCWQAWGDLLSTVRTGETAFDRVHGADVWKYRAMHPEAEVQFYGAMSATGEEFAEAVLKAFDFGRFRSIVDVGGGNGAFLIELLKAYPGMRGVLFDRLHVVDSARDLLTSNTLKERCETVGGDFFDTLPKGRDAYLLKWILHDWDDADSKRILSACRRAMAPGARLLVVEHVIGPPNASLDGKLLDLNMMIVTGGRERTREEFARLLGDASFELTSITPSRSMLSVIEAKPIVSA
jgi:SAM-dependent methyltransferase